MNATVTHALATVHVLMVSTSIHVPVLMGILGETANQMMMNACHRHANTMDSAIILRVLSIATAQRLDTMVLYVTQVKTGMEQMK